MTKSIVKAMNNITTFQEVTMDKKRAQEIASSLVMANVTYNGTPIYIENVNGNNGSANIHPLNQPDNRQEVSLNSLIEH
jgi:small acid-soluble spore protein H (minor)